MTRDFWEDAALIHVYTRAQAIEDGVPVDVTEQARQIRFKVPVAMTAGVWADCVGDDDGHAAARVFAVLRATMEAIREAEGKTDRVHFTTPHWRDPACPQRLWSLCGPGDTAEPVVTIMREGED